MYEKLDRWLLIVCAVLVLVVLPASCLAEDLLIDSFQYPNAEAALAAWPAPYAGQAGQAPLPAIVDNVNSLTLSSVFTLSTDRAFWDKTVSLDLSAYDYFTFRFKAADPTEIGSVSIAFLTGSGGWWGLDNVVYSPNDQWQTGFARRSDFSCEVTPAGGCTGWNDIRKIRILLWQARKANVNTNTYIADLYAKKAADQNMVINGGFENCTTEGLPDFWGTGHWGLGRFGETWVTDTDTWRTRWGVDNTVSHSGSRSLRIAASTDSTELRAVSNKIKLQAGKTYTLSVWMKSDSTNLPVSLFENGGGASQQVSVDNTWRRYTLSFVPPGASNTVVKTSIYITPTGNGTLWVDDVKLEANSVATDYSAAVEDSAFSIQTVHRTPPSVSDIVVTPGPNTVQVGIDESRRFLVDGQPFIPFAVGWESLPTANEFNHFARAGFNTVCFVAKASETVETIRTALDNAKANGLKVILWFDNAVTSATIQAWVTALRDHPAIIAWYVCDEPSSITPEAQAKYDAAKNNDPNRPVYINYWHTPLSLGDIASIDYYAISGQKPPALEGQNAEVLELFAAPAGKPSWLWIQDTGYAFDWWWSREPTGPEMESMTYLSLIHGVRGIKLFAQKPHSKELWDELRMLSREVTTLTPILYSLEGAPTASVTPNAIHVTTKTYQGQRYIIAANSTSAPVSATFTIPGDDSTATVQFENRQLSVQNGQFTDTFEGYQRHVYVLAGPYNDMFVNRTIITGNSGQITASNANTTKETGEPAHAGNSGGKSAWWSWTPATSGLAVIDTHGSNFDTLLAVYTGTGLSGLTQIAVNDNDGSTGNTSGLSFVAQAGKEYLIAVDGYNGAVGPIILDWSLILQADLALVMTQSTASPQTGGDITYSISVTNNGPSPASGVVLTDTLPPGAVFVSASDGCNQSGAVVTCALGTLASGATTTVQIVVYSLSTGDLTNSVSVTSPTSDPASSNNGATSTVIVVPAPVAGTWQGIGPDGGSISALAIDPQNTQTIYAGTNVIYKSNDGGRSWEPKSVGLEPAPGRGTREITAIAVDPADSNYLYAGSEGNIFKSTDGGDTWTNVTNTPDYWGGHIRALVIDPRGTKDNRTIYAGSDNGRGFIRIINNGGSWTYTNPAVGTSSAADILSLAVDTRGSGNTLYAATRLNNYQYAIIKSVDGGLNWGQISSPVSDNYKYINSLVINTATGTLYAGCETGVFAMNIDSGSPWQQIGNFAYADSLLLDSTSSTATLYSLSPGSPGVIQKTTDGSIWTVVTGPAQAPLQILAVDADPQRKGTLYVGSSYGLYKTSDSGTNWQVANKGIRHTSALLAIDPDNSANLYAAVTGGGVTKSTDRGVNWSTIFTSLGNSVNFGAMALDARDPQQKSLYWAAGSAGLFKATVAQDTNWQRIGSLPDAQLESLGFDPTNANVMYAGSYGPLYKTANNGQTWEEKSPPYAYIKHEFSSIVITPLASNIVYTGTQFDGIYKSSNGGDNWTSVNNGLPVFTDSDWGDYYHGINDLHFDPRSATDPAYQNIVYACSYDGIFKTLDGGASWNMLAGIPCVSFAIQPDNPDIMYASNQDEPGNVYQSDNGGLTWSRIGDRIGGKLPGVASRITIDPHNPSMINVTTSASGIYRYLPQSADAQITVAPLSASYGSKSVGTSTSQTFTISINSGRLLGINYAVLKGTNADQFVFTGDDCSGRTLTGPGASCQIQVSFNPTVTGSKTATLEVASTDQNAPAFFVPLNGVGVLP